MISEIIAKRNFHKANLMQSFETSSPKLCNRVLRYILYPNRPWVCVINVCSNGGAAYMVNEIKAKDNLNIADLMHSFENLLLQSCFTGFLDATHK